MAIVAVIAGIVVRRWLMHQTNNSGRGAVAMDQTERLIRAVLPTLTDDEQDAAWRFYKQHQTEAAYRPCLKAEEHAIPSSRVPTAIGPDEPANLARVGLLRLQMQLPQHREQLKDVRTWRQLGEFYGRAALALDELRTRDTIDLQLLSDREKFCMDILAYIDHRCAERSRALKYRDL